LRKNDEKTNVQQGKEQNPPSKKTNRVGTRKSRGEYLHERGKTTERAKVGERGVQAVSKAWRGRGQIVKVKSTNGAETRAKCQRKPP